MSPPPSHLEMFGSKTSTIEEPIVGRSATSKILLYPRASNCLRLPYIIVGNLQSHLLVTSLSLHEPRYSDLADVYSPENLKISAEYGIWSYDDSRSVNFAFAVPRSPSDAYDGTTAFTRFLFQGNGRSVQG